MVNFCSGLDIVALELYVIETPKEKEEMQRLLEEYAALQQDDHPEN